MSRCGLLQLIRDPLEMITIEYGKNRQGPSGSKRTLIINLPEFHNYFFWNLSGTPSTCKLFNIANFGRTLKGPKGPLTSNYGNFYNSFFCNLSGTPSTCKFFNLVNFGMTLKGPKRPLISNYGNFKIVFFATYQGPP